MLQAVNRSQVVQQLTSTGKATFVPNALAVIVISKMKLLSFALVLLASSAAFAKDLKSCVNESTSGISIIKIWKPSYPSSPYPKKMEGYVTLQIIVNLDGELEKSTIVKSIPRGVFDRSALSAIKKSKFSKSKVQKTRCGIYTYEFKLN